MTSDKQWWPLEFEKSLGILMRDNEVSTERCDLQVGSIACGYIYIYKYQSFYFITQSNGLAKDYPFLQAEKCKNLLEVRAILRAMSQEMAAYDARY